MRYFILLMFVLVMEPAFAQNPQTQEELGFISYLINSKQFDEAIYYLNKINSANINSNGYRDSLYYLKGKAFYNVKQLDSSAYWFLKVQGSSPFYRNSLFFASSEYIFLKNNNKAKEILAMIPAEDSLAMQARNLQFAGISLLEHDYNAYQKYSGTYGSAHYSLNDEKVILEDCFNNMKYHNNKSVFLAAAMSSILPGSGKIYGGKTGEGISSFLLVSFLAAITAENYIKSGPGNFKTITFASLFTIFYIGNIYGTIATLKVSREEYYKKYENTILLHIHLPLRNIYGK